MEVTNTVQVIKVRYKDRITLELDTKLVTILFIYVFQWNHITEDISEYK